jgi:hypothetical protein
MRSTVLLLTLLAALSSTANSAEDSTREVLRLYDKFLVPEDRKHIDSLIGGMQTGLMRANVELKHRGEALLYCQPDRLVITDSQMIDMMRRAIKDDAKLGDYPLGMVVLVTLKKVFPCR